MKSFIGFLVSSLCIILLVTAALALDIFRQRDLVLPRTVLGDLSLGGMTRAEARELIKEKLRTFSAQSFQIAARGVAQPVTLDELGVVINESIILDQIPFANRFSNFEIAVLSLAGQRVMLPPSVERLELLRIIAKKFPDIPSASAAHFIFDKNKISIVEAQAGLTPLIQPAREQINNNIAFLDWRPVVIEFRESEPTVFAADLEFYRARFEEFLKESIKLVHEKQTFAMDFAKHPDWLRFEKKPYVVAEGQLPFSLHVDPVAFSQFLIEKVTPSLEQAPENVRIWRNEDGKIQLEGRGNEGKAIEQERLLILVNDAIANDKDSVEIPLAVVPPKIEILEELQKLGIQELVAVGHTRFEGSPANRKHNIGVGISKYNGLLISPGAIFSFNENLGEVDDSTGYRKELVIKPEGTIPEFGGGLCQVSTTMYRAALNAGLPIVERSAHSYAVTYYSQVGGHGIDATIYPPSRDLKFTNDTPGHLLIQSYVDGVDAYFKFYGTRDDRKIVLEGPYISNKRGVPSEPLLVQDPTLKPGEKKQVEKPHGGFDALWYRYITKGGVTKKEEIFSRYKAVPAKFLVGGEVTPAGENAPLRE